MSGGLESSQDALDVLLGWNGVLPALEVGDRGEERLRDRGWEDRREDDDGDQQRKLRPVDDPGV
jgi:hypothetical protein